MLAEAEKVAAMPVDRSLPVNVMGDVLRAKLAAEGEVKALRAVLFPEDDDG